MNKQVTRGISVPLRMQRRIGKALRIGGNNQPTSFYTGQTPISILFPAIKKEYEKSNYLCVKYDEEAYSRNAVGVEML